jgi:HK97 family phage major capsid protein
MTINEMKEKRNRLSEETNRLVKGEMTAETRAQIDTMHADWAEQGKDIARAEAAEAMEQEMRSFVALPPSLIEIPGNVAENRNSKYKPVFGKFLRSGASGLSREEAQLMSDFRIEDRALTGSSGANGAFLIETDLQKTIREALKAFGGMRQVAEIWETSQGNPVTLPTNNDTANPGKRLNATTVPGTVDELDLVFGQAVFGTWTYTTQKITVSNELLRDAAFDIEKFIRNAFVTRIGRIQNTEFTVGTGTTMPVGLVTGTAAGVTAATGGSTSVTYNNLVDLIHSLDPAYRGNAKFMFHDTTLAALRKLVDSQNRPLLGLGINGADPDSVLGYRYQINQDMPVLAPNAKSLLFGDFAQAYTIRDVGNLSINRLDEIGMLTNSTIFVGFAAADGQYISAGVPAAVAFVNSAT